MVRHSGRKLFHLFGGLGLLSLYGLLGRRDALIGYALIALAVLAFDWTRLHVAALNGFIGRRFSSFIRDKERDSMTGMFPYVTGIGLAFLFYRPAIATTAVLFLACGDVAATAVGERFGQRKLFGEKSLEGTAAFIVAALLAGGLLTLLTVTPPPLVLFLGALVAAGVELLPWPLNDNLTIPVVAGGAMELLSRMIG